MNPIAALILAASADITSLRAGGDIIEARPSSEGHWAEIRYLNEGDINGTGSTRIGTYLLRYQGVEITVIIAFGEGSAERITVIPAAGMVAIPEVADVPDGSDIIIQIAQAMF